jgi:predicted AlkP superfamily phosphohydrolase/phosphomutase
MARKTGFTMEEHTQIGAYLRQAKSDFPRILVGISRHYPNTVGRSARAINKLRQIDKLLSTVCSELEELMAEEHPQEWQVEVYYGGAEPKHDLAVIAGEA